MATLAGSTIASTYTYLLKMDGTSGLTGSLVAVQDGDATDSALSISTAAISVAGNATITTADNTDTLTLTSTDADANSGPNLRMYRNSGSAANDDVLGQIDFEGKNNAGSPQDVVYATLKSYINDRVDGSEAGMLTFEVMNGSGALAEAVRMYNTATVFNNGAVDRDFIVKSDDNAAMFKVDAGTNVVTIKQEQAATALLIDQDGDGDSINIDSDATSGNCIEIATPLSTTGTIIKVQNANSLTTGSMMELHSASDSSAARALLYVNNDDVDANQTVSLKLYDDSKGATTCNTMLIDKNSCDGNAIFIDVDGDGEVSGSGIYVHMKKAGGNSDTSDNYIGMYAEVELEDDDNVGMLAGGRFQGYNNAGGGDTEGVYGVWGQGIQDAGTEADYVYGSFFQANVDGGEVDENIYGQYISTDVESGVSSIDNVYGQYIKVDTGTNPGGQVDALYLRTEGNCDFVYRHNNAGNVKISFTEDGAATYVGAVTASAHSDYAEYFESTDGKSIPYGTSVVIDNGKIKAASDGETPVGIIRPPQASCMIGNAQAIEWKDKYETTEYGEIILEDFTWTKWIEELTRAEYDKVAQNPDVPTHIVKGSEAIPAKEDVEAVDAVEDKYYREHKYHTDKIPSDLTAPDDAEVFKNWKQRNVINSNYDESKEYIPREERDEWNVVGLLGQIQMLKGQPTASNWIKMSDISDTVEMWFVK